MATKNVNYLEYVINNAALFGGVTWAVNEFSWDIKYAGVQIIASMVMFYKYHMGILLWFGSDLVKIIIKIQKYNV